MLSARSWMKRCFRIHARDICKNSFYVVDEIHWVCGSEKEKTFDMTVRIRLAVEIYRKQQISLATRRYPRLCTRMWGPSLFLLWEQFSKTCHLRESLTDRLEFHIQVSFISKSSPWIFTAHEELFYLLFKVWFRSRQCGQYSRKTQAYVIIHETFYSQWMMLCGIKEQFKMDELTD